MFEELKQAVIAAQIARDTADYWLDRCSEWASFIKKALERSINRAEEGNGGEII